MAKDLLEAEYRSILERYYGFFFAFEAALRANPEAAKMVAGLDTRPKTPDLRADLIGFGLSPAQIDALPICRSLPPLTTPGERLGAMYVTEGSALGGLLISKHLADFSFFRPERGTFFRADPKTVSERWKTFIGGLEAAGAGVETTVIESAVATFKALDDWMKSGTR